MTYLDCTVTGCVYNEDRCCTKGDIRVDGHQAKRTEETCCSSFRRRGENSVQNAAKRVSKEIDVSCEACNCMFNRDKKCAAEHIGIAGGNACTPGETECSSFCCEE